MINKKLLQTRLNTFYINWIQHKKELWGNSDIIVIHTIFSNPNSSYFLSWLLGDVFTNTAAIFTPYGIYIFCTHNNFSKLRELCSSFTSIQKIPTSVQLIHKNDDGFLIIDATIRDTRNIRNNMINIIVDANKEHVPLVIGYLDGEYPKSKLFLNCINKIESMEYQAASVNFGLAAMYDVADEPSDRPFEYLDEKLQKLQLGGDNHLPRELDENNRFTPFIYGKINNSVASTSSVMGASTSENNHARDYLTSSLRKDSVAMDLDDDHEDWMLIEGNEGGQEGKLANKFSWKSFIRWIMDKTAKSFRDKRKIN